MAPDHTKERPRKTYNPLPCRRGAVVASVLGLFPAGTWHKNTPSAPGAIRDWAARWAERIARLQALEVTPEFRRQIDFQAERMETRWRKFQKTRAARCALADAQLFVAREHGFASWPKFAKHLDAL